jgi:hypothetical protein
MLVGGTFDVMSQWDLKEWLEALAYLAAIVAPLVLGAAYLLRRRHEDIKALTQELARSWTNEGDINSEEGTFVDLDLSLLDGDLVGSLTCPGEERPLEAHVEVRWGRAALSVTRLLGRSLQPIGTVELKLKGNRNRLHWKLKTRYSGSMLPVTTVLWPNPVE